MALEVEALRAHNSSLHRQLEVNAKRIAELQEALEAAQRAAYRQAAPLPSLHILKIGYGHFFESKKSFLFLAYAARDCACQARSYSKGDR
jgi:hypothetical protein